MSISEFKDVHTGEKAFVIGNGPSLDDTPLDELQDEITFATNNIYKKYSSCEWRPTYYVYTSPSINADVVKKSHTSDTISIISSEFMGEVEHKEDIYFINRTEKRDSHYDCLNNPTVPEKSYDFWSDDLQDCVYWYNNSLFPIFQLVNYMGFDEIYLVGCDLGQDTTNHVLFPDASDPLFIDDIVGDDVDGIVRKHLNFITKSDKKAKSAVNIVYYLIRTKVGWELPIFHPGKDPHFGDEYWSSPKIYRGIDDQDRRAHKLAKAKLTEREINIYNCTIGGELEIHPRKDLADVLETA